MTKFSNKIVLGNSLDILKKIPDKTKKRCPKCTRRNKKTGECESKLITIENTTPEEDRLIAQIINQNIVDKTITKKDNIMTTVPKIQKSLKL